MFKKNYYLMNLSLFDGEGGGDAGAEAGAENGAAASGEPANPEAVNPNDQTKSTTKGRRAKNPLADVQYGKTEPTKDSQVAETKPAEEDPEQKRRADFDKFLKDNKDLDSERMQRVINQRFAETKGLQEQVDSYAPILDALKQKFGTEDLGEITQKLQEDDELVAERARENGLTLEQQKTLDKLTRENEELKRTDEQRRRDERAQEIRNGWIQEAEVLKQRIPNFDLAHEINNDVTGQRFKDLLAKGIDVETSYNIVHMNDILNNSVARASQEAQRRVVDDIKARGQRPQENGARSSAPSVISKPDPSKWTKADREEVSRRVLRGEKINL